jgi:hypothetical protein
LDETVVMGESRSCEGIAGGGRMNDVSGETRRGFSWPSMSVEATGVGGRVGRGMAGCVGGRVLSRMPTPRSIQHRTVQSIKGEREVSGEGYVTKGKIWNGRRCCS